MSEHLFQGSDPWVEVGRLQSMNKLLEESNKEMSSKVEALETRVKELESPPKEMEDRPAHTDHISNASAYTRAQVDLREALQTGSFMAAIFRVESIKDSTGRRIIKRNVFLRRTTWNFPLELFDNALNLLEDDAKREKGEIDTTPLPEASPEELGLAPASEDEIKTQFEKAKAEYEAEEEKAVTDAS